MQSGVQGWQTERVVQRDASSGRILLVLPHDPGAHQRKVRRRRSTAACVYKVLLVPTRALKGALKWLLAFLKSHLKSQRVGCVGVD